MLTKYVSPGYHEWQCLTWEYPVQNAEGAILGPFDCWLAMRGLKTMALRMRRQAASAAIIARWLARHPLIKKVNYPGLPAHPGHDIHAAQASAGGSLLSFETGRCSACPSPAIVSAGWGIPLWPAFAELVLLGIH